MCGGRARGGGGGGALQWALDWARTDAAEHVREERLEGFHLLVRFAGAEVGRDRFHGRNLPPPNPFQHFLVHTKNPSKFSQ